MATSPLNAFTLMFDQQARADLTVNGALQVLERLLQLTIVKGITTNYNAPPVTTTAGAAYLIGSAPTGSWGPVGNAGKIAYYSAAAASSSAPDHFLNPVRGLYALDEESGIPYRRSASAWVEQLIQKGVAILNPGPAEKVTMFVATRACTIRRVHGFVRGTGSPSITIDIRHGTDPSAAGTALLTGTTVAITNTTSIQTITSFSDATLAAGEVCWLTTTAEGGTTQTELFVDVEFNEDP